MSNKPKGVMPLPGKVTTLWDEYCRRWHQEGIKCLKRKNISKHQGSKSGFAMVTVMRAESRGEI